MEFRVVSEYMPKGDQPRAIKELAEGIAKGYKFQTLLSHTGSPETRPGHSTQQDPGRTALQ